MDKIYSRKRIQIPKISFSRFPNRKKDIRKQKMLTISVILIIALIVMYKVVNGINPIIDRLCIEASREKATLISNKKATEVMANYSYEDFVTVYKDKSNNVTMLKSNIISINEVTSDVAVKIQEEFKKDSESKLYISLRKPYRNKNIIRCRT